MKKLVAILSIFLALFIGINASAAATMFYTTKGIPTENSTQYIEPIILNKSMQIKYMIVDNATNKTKYGIIKHEITKKAKNQTIFPAISFDGDNITLTFPANVTVYYTLNGKNPTNKSAIYTAPIILNKNMIIKYMIVSGNATYKGVVKHTPCKLVKKTKFKKIKKNKRIKIVKEVIPELEPTSS